MEAVQLEGRSIRLDPRQAIGKGGEADIYKIGKRRALKVFKPPDHPDFDGQPAEQAVAETRIKQHQKKLPAFPGNLPPQVVAPEALATDNAGQIVGYAMPLVDGALLRRYADRTFREGVPFDTVQEVFRDLHEAVTGIHEANVVIGDFNDLNVLAADGHARLIDADSFQFGQWPCTVFTAEFADPTLCHQKGSGLVLATPHTPDSDWYAYAVMLMQTLLYVGPYGGVYRPKNPADRLTPGRRPLQRVTVFHPEVRYPKPAVPYDRLSDEMLDYFQRTFEQDERGGFPVTLLDNLRWTTCSQCGTEHARAMCPVCTAPGPTTKQLTVVRGKVTARLVFETEGVIVKADSQGGKLRWLYHADGEYRREDGATVLAGPLDPEFRFRISGDSTLIAKSGRLIQFAPGQDRRIEPVDQYGHRPMFDTNEQRSYRLAGGVLLGSGQFGWERIGNVLEGQTLFWVGPAFGLGFYRAGQVQVGFTFDAQRSGRLKDDLPISVEGQLIDATAVFSKTHGWLFTTTREGARTVNRVRVVRSDGTIVATGEADTDDGSWLGTIRGHVAAGNVLYAATDEGIVRVEPDGTDIVITKQFPDTEPFVDSGVHLCATRDGFAVVSRRHIRLLEIT